MAKYTLNREQLKECINNILTETIDADGISTDYLNDMNNLASTTGEKIDGDFLDSVARYDGRFRDGGPVYPDRKKEEMDADWREIDQQAKDSQARYGKNAKELDKLNAFSDVANQYVNDFNLNPYDYAPGFDALYSYDKARAEAEHPVESIIRKAVKEALDPYEHPEQSNDNSFAGDNRINANKFSHEGADAYWARKDQDKMHKTEKDKMKRADKRWQAAADKRPLHRKGSLNRAFDESKINESNCKYVFHYIGRPEKGNEVMCIDDLNDIKPYIKDALYWDVTKGNNSADPNNLVAWGCKEGKGGYWYNFLNKPEWAKEGVHWNKPSERERQLVLSKRKEFGDMTDSKNLKESYDDELSYDMKELTKAFQKANGTYQAKSSDGNFQTGDRVIVHGKKGNIEGVITDFGTHLMTWEETCDVDYDKDGKTWTLLSVPLDRIEKIQTTNESKLHEDWHPESEDDIADYSFGAIMKVEVNGVFNDLSEEQRRALLSIKDENIENENKYTSVVIRNVDVMPDGLDGYDINVEVAVSAPNMPNEEIESDVEEIVTDYIESKTGVRSPMVVIFDEKVVFDRRG